MNPAESNTYEFGPFRFDMSDRMLFKDGEVLPLPPKALETLAVLVKNQGKVVEKSKLIEAVWPDTFVEENNLSQNISILRKALGDPDYIQTVARRGFRFVGGARRVVTLRPSASGPDTPVLVQPAVKEENKPRVFKTQFFPWAVVGVVVVIAVIALGFLWRATRHVNQPLVRLSLELPEFAVTPEASAPGVSVGLAPDGTRVVYTGRGSDGVFRLYTRTLDQEQAVPLAGTEGAYGPFFSPDGQAVGFFAGGKLKKISIAGGGVVVLCDASKALGGSWGDDGNIIAALGFDGTLSRISSGGGAVQPVSQIKPERKDLAHEWPQVLPGAQSVVFTAVSTNIESRIETLSLRTGDRKTLVSESDYGRYVPSGHLLYMRGGTLFAAPMDPRRLALAGPATPMIEDTARSNNSSYAQFDFSRSGTLIYVRSKAQKLMWLDNTGQTQPFPAPAAEYNPAVRFSPDGKRLALGVAGKDNVDVWVYEWERDAMTRLTFNSLSWWPIWSPDGKHIAFMSGVASNLYYMRSDGAGAAVRLTESKNRQVPYSFSPDGKRLAFFEFDPRTKVDLWTLPLEEPESDHPRVGKPEPFLVTPADERAPMFSPDGRWLAYESDESGRNEVYVRPFPGPGGKWQISTGGGDRAVWSKKAPKLFYRSAEGMMVASYTVNGEAFASDKPRLWAPVKDLGTYFDLAPDGKRFAVLQSLTSEYGGPEHVMLLQNFFDELRRRAPASGR